MASVRYVAACGLLAACLAHAPGEPLGTFAVTGALGTQTCGASLAPVDPWDFDVRLSQSGHVVYWLQASAPAIAGTEDSSGNVTFSTSEIFDLSDPDAGVAYCGVVRSDKFEAALGTGAAPSSFTGTLTYHYDLDQGSACEGLLAGQFDTLPCDVSYSLTAKRTSP